MIKKKTLSFLLVVAWMVNWGAVSSMAQSASIENVSIHVPDLKEYDWITQHISSWKFQAEFPSEPMYDEKEIYTEKGLVTQKIYSWSNPEESMQLEVQYYPLPEVAHAKNERKLAETVAQRLALSVNGYPTLSESKAIEAGMRMYDLTVKTLRASSSFSAKIFIHNDQVLVAFAHLTAQDKELKAQSKYFLNRVELSEAHREKVIEDNYISQIPAKGQSTWDTLKVEGFHQVFPKYPVGQHRFLESNRQSQRFFEWYMNDERTNLTYVLALISLEDYHTTDMKKLVDEAIQKGVSTTHSKVESRRAMDYFKYPAEEVVLKNKHQYFRMRFFSDGEYLYQLLVGGQKDWVYQPDANRFLDGIQWRE